LIMVWGLDFGSEEWLDLTSVANMIATENAVNSFNALLIYCRAFKFMSMWGRLQKFKDSLSISVPNIMMYWLNISVIIFAFACAGFVAFGRDLRSFHTVSYSLVTMFTYAVGQYNFEELKAQDPFLGPFLGISYVCLVYFCLTCMFMAINCHTYNIVIRGLHITAASKLSLSGPDLIAVVNRKCRDWVENKIPSLRDKREREENEKRRQEKYARSAPVSNEMKAALESHVKAVIEICGPVEALEALGKYPFYRVVIEEKVKYEKDLPQFEYDEIMESISEAISRGDAADRAEDILAEAKDAEEKKVAASDPDNLR